MAAKHMYPSGLYMIRPTISFPQRNWFRFLSNLHGLRYYSPRPDHLLLQGLGIRCLHPDHHDDHCDYRRNPTLPGNQPFQTRSSFLPSWKQVIFATSPYVTVPITRGQPRGRGLPDKSTELAPKLLVGFTGWLGQVRGLTHSLSTSRSISRQSSRVFALA